MRSGPGLLVCSNQTKLSSGHTKGCKLLKC
jgi:hypothetical protein